MQFNFKISLCRITMALFSAVLASGCVEPFNADTSKGPERVVVDGSISNLAPPYVVTLTTTARYANTVDGIPRYVSAAKIVACDDVGSCIPFFEVSKGVYHSALSDTAVVGRNYHLEILLPDGRTLHSLPEKMIAPVEITRAYSDYDPATVLTEGFRLYVDTQDPPDSRNSYRWESLSYFKYSLYCFNTRLDKPLDAILSDSRVNGKMVTSQRVGNVPFDRTDIAVAQVYQHSISTQAFEFLEAVRKQVSSEGSIFDPPPSFLRGNLFNPADDNDLVLGYFFVSSASRKDVVIDRSIGIVPRPATPLVTDPLYCGDPCDMLCVTRGGGQCGIRPCPPDCASLPGNTNIAPAAWPLPHKECGF